MSMTLVLALKSALYKEASSKEFLEAWKLLSDTDKEELVVMFNADKRLLYELKTDEVILKGV